MKTKLMALEALIDLLNNSHEYLTMQGRISKAKAAIAALEADIAKPVEPATINNKFTRAWICLDQLPGVMMHGPEGLFGPVPASTSAWITTSEKERDSMVSEGHPMLPLYTTPQEPAANSLLAALVEIEQWTIHPLSLSVDKGSNGVRDFYRAIARKAISEVSAEGEVQDDN